MAIPVSKSLEQIIEKNFNLINNLNLLFTKYVGANKYKFELKSEQIGQYLQSIIDKKDDNTYNKFFTRWELLLNSINAVKIKGKVAWRLIIGFGSGSVLETSMTLHHIFGVPYIPGTAVKGVISSYYLQKNFKELAERMETINSQRKNDRKKEEYVSLENFAILEDKNYIKLFGNENQKGKVIFLDAYPTKFPKLEMDVMNPHFVDYYEGKTPPADWLSPIPIKFLTVSKDTEFIFAFKTEEDSIIEEVKTLLKEALENVGIGSKTSVGYGYFTDLEELSIPSIIFPKYEEKMEKVVVKELPEYLKSETELKDEYLNSDGSLKSEEEYKRSLEAAGKKYNKERRNKYEKAKKWYEKNKLIK